MLGPMCGVDEIASPYDRFEPVSTAPIGDPYGTEPELHGYGASGVAVADLDQDGTAEILVTTMNGEFVVFGQTNGVLGPRVFQTIVEGQLGGFNSIVVGNLDSQIGSVGATPEVYIASTTGIHKFYVP